MATLIRELGRSSLLYRRAAEFCILAIVFSGCAGAKDRWTELNIGPFTVDSRGDQGKAREALVQVEQLRWVMGTLLEKPDLRSLWPIRIVFVDKDERGAAATSDFISENGESVFACLAGSRLPLQAVARLLLEANTPRLPEEAESGLLQLFGTIQAKGSHVTWGGPIPAPTLPYARMQLFATRFEYSASFHILIVSLKNGSSLRIAERNAFGKDPAILEREAQANLQAANWQEVPVSGRPLDPKRDFGEHEVDGAVVGAALAATMFETDPKKAESLYKTAIEAGGAAKPLGFAGLAALATGRKEDPKPFWQSALRAGSMAPTVYVAAAKGEPASAAIPLLKKAAQMNPAWAVPVYEQAQLTSDPLDKEALLRKAAQINPRATHYWIELAQLQATDGHAIEAQGTWLQAQNSAPPSQRDAIEKMRQTAEQTRLDAAEAERTRERDATRIEDQRAQASEAARIRAAEEKANHALDSAAGDRNTESAVPWDATLPQKRFTGSLVEVECLRGGTRLTVRDRSGKTLLLEGDSASKLGLSCGVQQPAPRVALSYAVDGDAKHRTAGRVVQFQLP